MADEKTDTGAGDDAPRNPPDLLDLFDDEEEGSSQRGPESKQESTEERTVSPKGKGRTSRSARHVPHYQDRHEDFVLVSRAHLRELANFSWLQEGVGAAGLFFLSGAFWLIITLLAEHGMTRDYLPWLAFCIVSMLFGGVLIFVAWRHYDLKRILIEDIFKSSPKDGGND